jgi:rRNA maturation RNase YbeY
MVSFHSADRTFNFKGKLLLKEFIARIFQHEKKQLSLINYIFCSDEYLLQINQDFLQHDYYTDIITFGLSAPKAPIEAEVYISLDRIKDNATNLGTSYRQEALRVIFHGALHLCGYKDKSPRHIRLMRQKEDEYLKQFTKLTPLHP